MLIIIINKQDLLPKKRLKLIKENLLNSLVKTSQSLLSCSAKEQQGFVEIISQIQSDYLAKEQSGYFKIKA